MLRSVLPQSWRASALAVATLFCSLPAVAAGEDDIDGTWKLETNVFEAQCKITGDFTFTATKVKNAYTCRFISTQTCGTGFKTSVTVEQSCTAQRVGKQVAIKSKVEKILKREPANEAMGYYADNFIVTITKPGTEMVGGHYDEIRQLKARFWRVRDLTS